MYSLTCARVLQAVRSFVPPISSKYFIIENAGRPWRDNRDLFPHRQGCRILLAVYPHLSRILVSVFIIFGHIAILPLLDSNTSYLHSFRNVYEYSSLSDPASSAALSQILPVSSFGTRWSPSSTWRSRCSCFCFDCAAILPKISKRRTEKSPNHVLSRLLGKSPSLAHCSANPVP